jgi:hypothetical protein
MEKKPAETAPEPAVFAIVELMGHVRIAGRLTEEERFGAKMGRLDIPQPDGSFVTQHFGGGSVYRITYCDEATARAVAKASKVEPVHAQLAAKAIEDDEDRPF